MSQVTQNLRQLLSSTRGTMQTGLLKSLLDYAVQKQSETSDTNIVPVSPCFVFRPVEVLVAENLNDKYEERCRNNEQVRQMYLLNISKILVTNHELLSGYICLLFLPLALILIFITDIHHRKQSSKT